MISQLIRQLRESGKLKWVVLAGVLLVIIVVWALLSSDKPQADHKLAETTLNANQNFGYLSGTDVYAYNGAAFYKIALDSNNSVTVLHSGSKLPAPGTIHWANDRGALLNFKESFTLTRVEQELQATTFGVNQEDQDDTWYLDFSSGSLRRVSDSGVNPGLAYYSEKDKGFYYIPNTRDGKTTLRFYDIESNNDRLIAEDLKIVDVSHLGSCSGYRVCLIARDNQDPQNERLYAVDSNNQKSQLLDSGGRLFATNDSEQYITVKSTAAPSDQSPRDARYVAEEEDLAYLDEPATLRNIGGDSAKDLGFNVGNLKIITHINSGAYAVLDGSLVEDAETEDEQHLYWAGKTNSSKASRLPLQYANGNKFTTGLISRASHGTSNELLVSAIGGEQLLFTTRKGFESILPKDSQPDAQAKVNNCVSSSAKDSDYFDDERQFKIYFVNDGNFDSNIQKFSECLLEGDARQVAGYNFYFGALDPINGKIVSD